MGKLSFNDGALRHIALHRPPDREGRLQYRQSNDSYKERFFRLCGNLLFYFRTNDRGTVSESSEPLGVLVLASCNVKLEEYGDRPFVFSIVFDGEDGRKHFFGGQTLRQCAEWVEALQSMTYSAQAQQLEALRQKLIRRTGIDPLPATVATSHGHQALQQTTSGQRRVVSAPVLSKQKLQTLSTVDQPGLKIAAGYVAAQPAPAMKQQQPVKRPPPPIPPAPRHYQPSIFFVGNEPQLDTRTVSTGYVPAVRSSVPIVQTNSNTKNTDAIISVPHASVTSNNPMSSAANKLRVGEIKTVDGGFKEWEKFE